MLCKFAFDFVFKIACKVVEKHRNDANEKRIRVLDHMTNGTTLLIADKAVAWRPFSLEPLKTRPEEAPTPYPNDFSLSYLKDELNGPFLAAFDTAGGPIRSANIAVS